MTNAIVEEKLISFKTLEQEIFKNACKIAREHTKKILESYDDMLSKERDASKYRNKGKRKTSIKTVYGEVEYERRVYQTRLADGTKAHVYLLDRHMGMEKIGLISTNLAEKIANSVTELPYRASAEILSSSTGQVISAGGVWSVTQKLGVRISSEEELDVKKMKAGIPDGKREVSILFEEMDGVWLSMQGKGHKRTGKKEMKVFTMYEGWDAEKEKEGRSALVEKVVFAGMDGSSGFHKKREAVIQKKYNPDEIERRILNGDGGSWIKEPYDDEAIFQLDRYHIYQEILRKISSKGVQKEIRRLFDSEKLEEMFAYIREYIRTSKSDDESGKTSKRAEELYNYLYNNREGLLPYYKRGIAIPKPAEGIIYKNMGIQETQNCTLITLRMKHRRMRWSESGADNLAKLLCRKENKNLIETVERYSESLIFDESLKEIKEPLSASKSPWKDGKGLPYMEVSRGSLPLTGTPLTAGRKALRKFILGN